jgi:adenylate cyclase class 2
MYEVEVKVPADLDAVRERLQKLDATRVETVEQTDTYYDAPHRDFAASDEAFRVRREESRNREDAESRITYKGPLVDDASKTREEHETAVGDGAVADAIVRSLGFDPAATVRKHRETWALDDYTVTLDAVDDVGEFVEVETEVADGVAEAREGAFAVLERLDLDPDDQIRTSYLGLLLAPDDDE